MVPTEVAQIGRRYRPMAVASSQMMWLLEAANLDPVIRARRIAYGS
jgi:hypothetical protein